MGAQSKADGIWRRFKRALVTALTDDDSLDATDTRTSTDLYSDELSPKEPRLAQSEPEASTPRATTTAPSTPARLFRLGPGPARARSSCDAGILRAS